MTARHSRSSSFWIPCHTCSSDWKENPKSPCSPAKRKLSASTIAPTSAWRNCRIASTTAARLASSASKKPEKSKLPPASPLGMGHALGGWQCAGRAQGRNHHADVLLDVFFRVFTLRGDQEKRPMSADHVGGLHLLRG